MKLMTWRPLVAVAPEMAVVSVTVAAGMTTQMLMPAVLILKQIVV
jgi:hypothetical protein